MSFTFSGGEGKRGLNMNGSYNKIGDFNGKPKYKGGREGNSIIFFKDNK